MATLGSMIGGKHEITLGDVTYHVSPITLQVEADFERKLFAKARDKVSAMKESLSPDDYIALLKAVTDSYAMGQYKLMGKLGLAALQSIEGLVSLCSLMFDLPEKKMIEIIRQHTTEVTTLMQTVLKESLVGG